MTIVRSDLWRGTCTDKFINTTLNWDLFDYGPDVRNLTLYYGCSSEPPLGQDPFTCTVSGREQNTAFYAEEHSILGNEECYINFRVPVSGAALDGLIRSRNLTLGETLNGGFEVMYEMEGSMCSVCNSTGGICGSNVSDPIGFMCLCKDQPGRLICAGSGNKVDLPRKIIIGVIAAIGSGVTTCIIFFIYLRRRNKRRHPSPLWFSRNASSYFSSKTDLEKQSTYYGAHIFEYAELEEATNNFDSSKELGDGGFGTVYYGKLRDGRVVAVKRLYQNNCKRVEQFKNEVEILTRLRHQNLVSLYGCTSRHDRELLLVYEYIPNGTVADHLHGERAKPDSLSWPTRMSIAIETATALAYLHASDIIHRDVKTNNILLDNNFCVKVADFGLSRLFPNNATHISTAPQGTPGYVDPDYHQCYHLTDKSDVYSFGVVLIELISSMPAVDITRHRHEINLSNLAINKIQSHALHELVDPHLGFESDFIVRKMVTAMAELAFQCLQYDKEVRPTMEDVLEALTRIESEGNEVKQVKEVDLLKEDVLPIKGELPPLSPDSVAIDWISRSTTPNPSN